MTVIYEHNNVVSFIKIQLLNVCAERPSFGLLSVKLNCLNWSVHAVSVLDVQCAVMRC
jgi:hypothetical protein